MYKNPGKSMYKNPGLYNIAPRFIVSGARSSSGIQTARRTPIPANIAIIAPLKLPKIGIYNVKDPKKLRL